MTNCPQNQKTVLEKVSMKENMVYIVTLKEIRRLIPEIEEIDAAK